MLAPATALINGAALWKIILASLIGGAGVAIAFGLLLLGAGWARTGGREHSAGSGNTLTRVSGYGLVTVAGAFCLAAVVVGLIAMFNK